MGTTSSKNWVSTSAPYVESMEQLSSWETVFKLRSHVPGKSFPLQRLEWGSEFQQSEHVTNVPITNGTCIKVRFLFREEIKWLGRGHGGSNGGDNKSSYGIRGLSLWMTPTVESGDKNELDPLDTFLLSVQVCMTVNGKDSSSSGAPIVFRDVFVRRGKYSGDNWREGSTLLHQNILELTVLHPQDDGHLVETPLYSGKVHLKVNTVVKLRHRMINWDIEELSWARTAIENRRPTEGAAYLVKDLKKLYSGDNVLSDVVLKSSDGMTLNAHKIILAARSPYFRRWILWNPAAFTTRAPVTIDDIKASSLIALLHWMYTGELMEDVSNFMDELVQTAIKFEMVDLLKVLEKQKLDPANKSSKDRLRGVSQEKSWHLRSQSSAKESVRKLKRAVLAWFPLLRYRFGNRPVGLVASIINAVHGIYELFQN